MSVRILIGFSHPRSRPTTSIPAGTLACFEFSPKDFNDVHIGPPPSSSARISVYCVENLLLLNIQPLVSIGLQTYGLSHYFITSGKTQFGNQAILRRITENYPEPEVNKIKPPRYPQFFVIPSSQLFTTVHITYTRLLSHNSQFTPVLQRIELYKLV